MNEWHDLFISAADSFAALTVLILSAFPLTWENLLSFLHCRTGHFLAGI
jgi:hypothetical protein